MHFYQILLDKSRKKGKVKIHIANDFKNCGSPPPISYKSNQDIIKIPMDKADSMKVDIKAKLGEKDIETVAIYMTLFSASV